MIQCTCASIWHIRFKPKEHQFSYPYLLVRIPITSDGVQSFHQRFFSTTKKALLTVRETDYLHRNGTPLFQQLQSLTRETEWGAQVTHYTWITTPRLLGLTFNPVSFYYALDQSGKALGMVVEVNNTFHQRHIYLLSADLKSQDHPKEFHVSPFNNMDGSYHFSFSPVDKQQFHMRIALQREEEEIFQAGMTGSWCTLSFKSLTKALIQSRFSPWLTVIRIHLQAFVLFFIKRLSYNPPPVPTHIHTIIKNEAK